MARGRGLAVAGLIVTETTPRQGLAEETCIAELESRIEVPLLAVIPHQAEQQAAVPEALTAVDWWDSSRPLDQDEA